MTNLEKLFGEEKRKIDELKTPNELEEKLRAALEKTPEKRFKGLNRKIAALIVFALLIGYNIDTLAYYSKKLIGYENVMYGTLKELNELGKGQTINKKHVFSDGVSVLLDGAMLDDNNLIVFYTIEDPKLNVQGIYSRMNISITGIGGRWLTFNGAGEVDDEGRYLKWILRTHEAPKFFENDIKLVIDYELENGNKEHGEISFKLNRNEAVGKSLEMTINKKVSVSDRALYINSLTASPTSTVITGKIQNIFELGYDHINDSRMFPEEVEMALYADGKEVFHYGSAMTTDVKGISFEERFDALPRETKEIELKLISFVSGYDVDEEFSLEKGEKQEIEVLGQVIQIEDIYEKDNYTFITIRTEETTTLSKVHLKVDDESKELLETIPGELEKIVVDESAVIYNTRTLKFEGTGDNLQLHIQKIRFKESFNETIYTNSIE